MIQLSDVGKFVFSVSSNMVLGIIGSLAARFREKSGLAEGGQRGAKRGTRGQSRSQISFVLVLVFTDPICWFFFKHGFGHAFKCSDWLCLCTLFFATRHRDTLGSVFPGTRDVARVIRVTSEYKVRNLI